MRFYFLFIVLLSYTPFSQINWYQIATDTNKQIFELFTDSDGVYVAGNFTQIGGIQSDGFTLWNGATCENLSSSNFRANTVTVKKTRIYFGRNFSSDSTSESASNIVKFVNNSTIITSYQNISEANVPNEFALKHKYPNPFNPTTTIKFTLAEDVVPSLKIYNILVKEFQKLEN